MQTGQMTVQTGQWAGATPEPRLAGVPSAIASVEATIAAVAQNVTSLIERLEKAGVVLPAPPQAEGSSQPMPPTYNTSLANAIDRFRAQGQAINAALIDLRERIDL